MAAFQSVRSGIACLLLTALLFLVPAASAAVGYLPIDVADPSWTLSQAADVNARGHVVGVSTDGFQTRGFLYSGGTVRDICPPGWTSCLALSISNSDIVGGAGASGGGTQGFTYAGGVYTPLTVPGATATVVSVVNDSGDAAGYAVVGGVTSGFRRVGGSFTTFLPGGYTDLLIRSMNSGGDVVGYGSIIGVNKAFAYVDGAAGDPSPPGWTDTEARSINDRGQIIGIGDSGGVTRCWLNSGGAFTIILPPGWESSSCTDINSAGDIVGSADDGSGGGSAFVFHKGKYYFIDGVLQLSAISDKGHIAGMTIDAFWAIRALAGLLLPETVLTANGSDGPVVLPPGKPLTLKASLAAFGLLGRTSDWWIFAQTPSGPFTFDIASLRWVPGFRPAAVMPLRDVPKATLPPAGTARGLYTYFLGVDLVPNSRVDVPYLVLDRVVVFAR